MLGHCHLTHIYLLWGNDQRMCRSRPLPLTVKHNLRDCPYLQNIRHIYFTACFLTDIFGMSTVNLVRKSSSSAPVLVTHTLSELNSFRLFIFTLSHLYLVNLYHLHSFKWATTMWWCASYSLTHARRVFSL